MKKKATVPAAPAPPRHWSVEYDGLADDAYTLTLYSAPAASEYELTVARVAPKRAARRKGPPPAFRSACPPRVT